MHFEDSAITPMLGIMHRQSAHKTAQGLIGYAVHINCQDAPSPLIQYSRILRGTQQSVVGHLRQGDLTFLSHVRRFLVIAKPDKFTVPQVVIPGPFHEFDLRYQLGLHP
jgi:hypothetical protein